MRGPIVSQPAAAVLNVRDSADFPPIARFAMAAPCATPAGAAAFEQTPSRRPSVDVPTNPPLHPAHLESDEENAVVQVPPDGMCLYHCAAAAEAPHSVAQLSHLFWAFPI